MLRWIGTKISATGLSSQLFGGIGFASSIITICQAIGADQDPTMRWAMTVAFFFSLFLMLINVCAYSQGVLRDEVNRCAKAKSKLEKSLLNKRKSSKGN